MFKDAFNFMMAAYSKDAEQEIAEGRRQLLRHRQEREASLRRNQTIKRACLGIVLAGVAGAVYWAHDLGGLLATSVTTYHAPDPTLVAPPKSNAKQMRRFAEMRRQRDAVLEQIEQ